MVEVLAAAPQTPATTPATPPAAAQAAAVAATPPVQATPAQTDGNAKPATPVEAKPPADTAPAKYAAFTVPKGLPEGHQLAEPVVKSVEDVSRKLGLTQERAQTLVDEVMPSVYRHGQEQLNAMVAQWDAELAAHKELGGAKLDESRATVKLAVEKLDPSGALMAFLESPFKPGHNPAVFAALHQVGKWLQQDGFVASRSGPSSGSNQGDDASIAAKFYPNSPQPKQ